MRLTLGLLPAFALHLFVALPDGRLTSAARRRSVAAGYVVGLAIGAALCTDLDSIPAWPIVTLWAAALCAGVPAASSGIERQVPSTVAASNGSGGGSPSRPRASS